MSPQSVDRKEKRRKSIERKKCDKLRRNPVAQNLSDPKFRQRVVENKIRGGSKNLTRFYEDDNE